MADREAETIQLRAEPARTDDDARAVLPRRFVITGKLGEGGAGIVYQAHDAVLQRDVAIKVLARHRDALEEARAAAELRHESIVTIFDVDPGGRYIVMELCTGETLQRRLARRGRLSTGEIYELGRRLLGALSAAHERKIIHRDVKPGNIMFDRRGIKLSDFGVARRMSSELITEIAGTPAYMAPEVWEGAEPDARTDVFGVGVTLWEAAVGRGFRDQVPEDVGAKQVLEVTRDARLADAIKRAIAVNPAERFASASDFAAALGPVRAGRHRGAWIAGLGLAGAAVALGALRIADSHQATVVPEHATIVATVPFIDTTRKQGGARLELAALLAGELRHAPNVEVVSHDQMIARTSCTVELADPVAWRQCAATFHADAVVSGVLKPDGDRITVELAVTALDGTQLGRVVAHAGTSGVEALVRRHAHQIADLVTGRAHGEIVVDPDLDLGIEALHQANYLEARRLLAAVLAREPGQADALYYTAIALYWQSSPPAEVDAAFDRALAVKLTPMQEGIVRGFRLLDHHELSEAITHWKRLVEQFPTHTIVLYGLMEALFHGGYPADAVVRYRQLAEADRDFRLALMHPFEFYVVRGDSEGASWALARNQRFGVRNLTEWQVRMRVMAGDLSGAYMVLLAEVSEAERRGTETPFQAGVISLAIARDDQAAVRRVLKTAPPPSEIAIGLWSGDPAVVAHGFERLASGVRSRGRRGAYDAARVAPIVSLAEDVDLARSTLSLIDEMAKGDPALSVNEQLGRVFLLGRIGSRAELATYARSPIPEVSRVASAFTANLDGKPARDVWQQAFALSADGMFVLSGKAHLAQALHAAGDHEGVLAVCSEILEPRIVDLAVAPSTTRCLAWSAEASEAVGKREQAIAMYRRIVALPGAEARHVTAVAALRRLR